MISRTSLLIYALPALALALPTIPLYVYLPTLYAEGLGLGLATTGAVLLVARAFDVVTDPLIGIASDRLTTRWGRRKPWIALGAVIGGFALLKLFDPPAAVTPGYLLVWSIVVLLGWTMIAIPYTAWAAELSNDYDERTRITGAREALMVVGVVLAGGLPAAAVAWGGTERDGLVLAAWLAIGLGLPTITWLLWKTPERAVGGGTARRWSWRDYRGLLANRPFMRLMTAWFVNGCANGLPAVLFPLYVQYGLAAGPMARGLLITVYFLAGVLAIPGWVWLSQRYGKHRVWCWAMLLACAAFVWVPLLGPGDVTAFFVICVVTGMALGADLALPPAMQADVVDLDTLRLKQERAGLFFALWSMSSKLALALAVGVAFPMLAWVGFQTGAANTPAALLALALIYALVPTVLKLGAVMLIWGHPITSRRQRIIRRRLASRQARAAKG